MTKPLQCYTNWYVRYVSLLDMHMYHCTTHEPTIWNVINPFLPTVTFLQPIFALWRLSDSKCWNGGHEWVKKFREAGILKIISCKQKANLDIPLPWGIGTSLHKLPHLLINQLPHSSMVHHITSLASISILYCCSLVFTYIFHAFIFKTW